ncbi:hypothetical protein DN752_04720 [Echinicola strongylocentroti]|uniref:Uncharacterized protein n=1 Tax=Echinicola strongylocentroti TaxID=1795355 RepID=A0A2Z4IEH7_9BACT|nr:hypothetical protein [Echinicola strongylocentroti]AWW29491.1 hypothetical protein DN752_04720 [Echinicola strongylocentroti]
MMKVGLFIPFSGQVSRVEQEIQNGLRIGMDSGEHDEVDFAVHYYQDNVQKESQKFIEELDAIQDLDLIVAVTREDWAVAF